MLAVYVVLAIGLVVGIRYFRKLRAESHQAQKGPRTLQNYRSNWKREKRLQAKAVRARLIGAAVQLLSVRMQKSDRAKQENMLVKAQKMLEALAGLDRAGRNQLERLLEVSRPRQLWLLVEQALWKAYERGGGLRPIDKISVLRQISEEGRARSARIWALEEMPGVLAASPEVWDLAFSAIATCRQEGDQEIAEAAAHVLKPVAEAQSPWARELLCHSIESSTSRPALLFAIPATEGFGSAPDVEKALRAIWTCAENVVEGQVLDVAATTLRVHRRAHPVEFRKVAAEQQPALRERITREVDDERPRGQA
jgi:hypothetical protein